MKKFILAILLVCIPVFSSFAHPNTIEQNIKVKEVANPDVYIDGVKYDKKILDLIDPAKIENVSVIKGEEALKKYNSKEGVILVTTKSEESISKESIKVKKVVIRKDNADKNPLVIINGIVSNSDTLNSLQGDKIEKIDVLKDESAIAIYGENGKNGVILITTKAATESSFYSCKIKGNNITLKDNDSYEEMKDKALIIINGKEVDSKILDNLDPDNIKSVEILKNEAALQKYNAKDGVIIIKTKKK